MIQYVPRGSVAGWRALGAVAVVVLHVQGRRELSHLHIHALEVAARSDLHLGMLLLRRQDVVAADRLLGHPLPHRVARLEHLAFGSSFPVLAFVVGLAGTKAAHCFRT